LKCSSSFVNDTVCGFATAHVTNNLTVTETVIAEPNATTSTSISTLFLTKVVSEVATAALAITANGTTDTAPTDIAITSSTATGFTVSYDGQKISEHELTIDRSLRSPKIPHRRFRLRRLH
jgi:hypothetical protein